MFWSLLSQDAGARICPIELFRHALRHADLLGELWIVRSGGHHPSLRWGFTWDLCVPQVFLRVLRSWQAADCSAQLAAQSEPVAQYWPRPARRSAYGYAGPSFGSGRKRNGPEAGGPNR